MESRPSESLLAEDEYRYWKQTEEFEKRYWSASLTNGAIPICHEGCALRILLVITGSQAGFLWSDQRSEYSGLRPVILASGNAATFSNWYNEWLQEALRTLHN